MKFWKRQSRYAIRKELTPKERNLLSRLRKTLGRNHFPYRLVLLYLIQEPEPLWKVWPALKEVDEYKKTSSENFKRFAEKHREKLRKILLKSMEPDKRFISGSRP